MTFSPGTKLVTYEIVGPLGAGGMGEVYRARDLKLKREVAIKVLPDAFSRDVNRVARFQREAEVLASLNHPLIGSIYDLALSGESQFIVLELVEGETLAERIARGPIPIDDALQIARQIAEGLEAAHEKGIVHRDLKPANVKLTPEGKVKVLDFGLAKVRETADAGVGLSDSPTFVTGVSTPGAIIGTALYMSPEQAKGRDADRTSDVWAFGCVLYEMLTGSRVFDGESVSEVFAGILKGEPDWNRLPAGTPENIRRLLRRCLNKNRHLRLQHLGDARIEIDEPDQPDPNAPAPRRRERIAAISALLLLPLLALGIWGLWNQRPVVAAPEIRLDITMPPGSGNSSSFSISPDGQKIVFAAASGRSPQLWLRSLGSVSANPIPKTDGPSNPFWSPDNRSIAFFSEGKLKRVDIDTGTVQTLTNAPAGRGGTWNADGVIVFPPTNSGPLFRVPATGGEPIAVTNLAPRQANHRHPQFLPDGKHFIYYATGDPEVRGIYVGQLDGSDSSRLLDSETAGVYAPPGQLLFVRDGTLLTQAFDVDSLELSGNPSPVAENVLVDGTNRAALSASATHSLIFRSPSAAAVERELVWVDRSGNVVEKVRDTDANPVAIALSPDGRYVALQRAPDGNQEIDLLDLARSLTTSVTRDPGNDRMPVWSPDGRRIVFDSNRNGAYDLYESSTVNAGSEQILLSTPKGKSASDWSPDNAFILYRSNEPDAANDIWALPYDRKSKEFPVVRTKVDEGNGQFAPNGKWIAYDSNESGRREIWVQQFPAPGSKTRISSNGGWQPRWSKDGKELFYIGLDDRLMAVSIRIGSDGQTIEAAAPVALFDSRLAGRAQGIAWQYAVSPDGQRFLVNTVVRESASPITVILNWKRGP